jgi:hypothetical protein
MMSSIGSAISRLLQTSYRWLTPYAAFVNGDTTIAGAGRRRSSKACRDGKWRVSGRHSSNVTQSPTSHPSCVSGFCFSSPHALNSPAAITVMIPRRHISLCSPSISLRYGICRSRSLWGHFGRQRRAPPTARRCAEGRLPAQICRYSGDRRGRRRAQNSARVPAIRDAPACRSRRLTRPLRQPRPRCCLGYQ